MASGDGRYVIVYNGELYNYRELRCELEGQGVQFNTQGDSEVVLAMIARHWVDALRRFDGMFGIAVWDELEQRLLLARDPIGEKPLFISQTDGRLIFASEVQGVLAGLEATPSLNMNCVRQALRFRALYGTETLFNGIEQLLPGGWFEFSANERSVGRFFCLRHEVERARMTTNGHEDSELIDRGRELFVQSVRERMVADVPVGAFLSGGLDSSLIVATMRALSPDHEINTFSVGFEGDPNSELPFAADVATALETRHHAIRVSPTDFIERLSELSVCRGGPVSEPADVAIACMSREAKKYVKVVLSGEGADELFAGYPKYRFADAGVGLRSAVRLAEPLRLIDLARLIGLPTRRARIALRALSGKTELDRLVSWFSYTDRALLRSWFPSIDWSDDAWSMTTAFQAEVLREASGLSCLGRMQYLDVATWLPGNLLERGDRMTMAEGLEARPPFLDTELVAFGLALPDRLKFRSGIGKRIVRQWAESILPAHIVSRRKWGFRVPLGKWFREDLKEWLGEALLADDGFCGEFGSQSAILRLLEEHCSGAQDHDLTLWTLLSTDIWYRTVIQGRSPLTVS